MDPPGHSEIARLGVPVVRRMSRVPNQALRQARLRTPAMVDANRPMSRAELAEAVNTWLYEKTRRVFSMSANQIGKYERGENHWPRQYYRDALRAVLHATADAELGFRPTRRATEVLLDQRPDESATSNPMPAPAPTAERAASAPRDTLSRRGEVELVRRRTLFTAVPAVLGLGALTAALGTEATRHQLSAAFTDGSDERAVPGGDCDEWDEIVREYGYRYLAASPDDLLGDLNTDLRTIQVAVHATRDDTVRRRLCGAAARLAVFQAMILGDLGDLYQGRRWWRTAVTLSDRGEDRSVMMWVRGRQIVRAQYEQLPVAAVLDLVRRAEPIAATAPLASWTEFVGGKAQALAMAGRSEEARATLADVYRVFDQQPADVVADSNSLLGWPIDRVRYTESYVYSYLGDLAAADVAQRQAIQAYPPGYRRGPAQIELQRALCLIAAGDCREGTRHAHQVLTALPAVDRNRPVVDLAQRVLRTIPTSERHRRDAIEYRDLLTQIDGSRATAA